MCIFVRNIFLPRVGGREGRREEESREELYREMWAGWYSLHSPHHLHQHLLHLGLPSLSLDQTHTAGISVPIHTTFIMARLSHIHAYMYNCNPQKVNRLCI